MGWAKGEMKHKHVTFHGHRAMWSGVSGRGGPVDAFRRRQAATEPDTSNLFVVLAGMDRYDPNTQACQVSWRKNVLG